MKNESMLSAGPLVTVYIPCRNYARYLTTAVKSVMSQLYQNWELVIVDEASNDGSAALAGVLAQEDPERIRVVCNEEPVGLQRVANSVLESAGGKYFIRLDADDWFEETALLLMVAKLESDSRLALAYGNYYYTSPDGNVIGLERRRKHGEEDKSGHLPPHGACTMVRTRHLKAVGGYSTEFTAQDGWELWHKLSARFEVASIEAPLFYYRQHETSLSTNSQRLLDARAQILARTREKLEGSFKPSCLAVIPVRESYPGFDGVPYKTLGDKSLLERAILSAQEAVGVTHVAVSSDSANVMDYTRQLVEENKVAPVLIIERPQEISGRYVRFADVLLHAAKVYSSEFNVAPDMLLFLSLHAPLRRSVHIDKCIDVLRIHVCDSVVTVCEERSPILRHGERGLDMINPGRFDDLDYEREKLFRFNGAVLGIWLEILDNGGLFGEHIGHVEMTPQESYEIRSSDDPQNVERYLAEQRADA